MLLLHEALDAGAQAPRDVATAMHWTATSGERAHAYLELIDEQVPANRWPDTSARELVSAVGVAAQIITADSLEHVEALAARHGVLDPVGSHTPIWPKEHDIHPRNPLLMSLRLGSLSAHLSLSQQLMYRTASERPRAPVRVEHRAGGRRLTEGTWPARGWVPPVLWDGELADHVVAAGSYGPAALSLALSKVGSSVPLRAIAVDLGLPAWLADRVAAILGGRSRPDQERLARSLEQLFARLEANPPPVNYSKRVAVARDLAMVRAAAVEAAALQLVALDERGEAGATVALWVAYTGSHPRFCPLLVPGQSTPSLPPRVDRTDFLRIGFQLLPHGEREPLAWSPP